MLSFLPTPLLGVINVTVHVLNTIFIFIIMLIPGFIKLLSPTAAVREWANRTLIKCAELWISINNATIRTTLDIEWDAAGADGLQLSDLEYKNWYLVIANHLSSADILALQYIFNKRIPFMKFFIKQELFWLPLIGQSWWALDMPFMKRYSKAYLRKHPEKKGQDLETTRRSCEKFRYTPTTVINFVEGTRFTPEKYTRQQPSYRYLTQAKSGGAALVISVLHEQLDSVLDITIAYPGHEHGTVTYWEYVSGRVDKIVFRVRRIPIPAHFGQGDYAGDPEFKAEFQAWINQIWAEKDELLEDLLAGTRSERPQKDPVSTP